MKDTCSQNSESVLPSELPSEQQKENITTPERSEGTSLCVNESKTNELQGQDILTLQSSRSPCLVMSKVGINGIQVPIVLNNHSVIPTREELQMFHTHLSQTLRLSDDIVGKINTLQYETHWKQEMEENRNPPPQDVGDPIICISRETPKELSIGYVYLMRNKRNGYVKIGYSANPSFREKTLQSEEPDIELFFQFSGSMTEERFLHQRFKDKRLRGEWFSLTEEDISAITLIYS